MQRLKLTGINTELEWFLIECRKTKTKVILSVTKDTDNAANQSKLEGQNMQLTQRTQRAGKHVGVMLVSHDWL